MIRNFIFSLTCLLLFVEVAQAAQMEVVEYTVKAGESTEFTCPKKCNVTIPDGNTFSVQYYSLKYLKWYLLEYPFKNLLPNDEFLIDQKRPYRVINGGTSEFSFEVSWEKSTSMVPVYLILL